MNVVNELDLPHIVSIQVGLPKQLGVAGAADPMDRPWTTGFFKEPITGAVHLGQTNLDGNGQADLVLHGGPDKAVLAYAATHYPQWQQVLGFSLTLPATRAAVTDLDPVTVLPSVESLAWVRCNCCSLSSPYWGQPYS